MTITCLDGKVVGLWMDPWMDEKFQLVIVILAIRANHFSIYNILMIKTNVASLELQYVFDNQFVSKCLLVFSIIYWQG